MSKSITVLPHHLELNPDHALAHKAAEELIHWLHKKNKQGFFRDRQRVGSVLLVPAELIPRMKDVLTSSSGADRLVTDYLTKCRNLTPYNQVWELHYWDEGVTGITSFIRIGEKYADTPHNS